MVATILKNVTSKGIEAASLSVSSGLHSNPGTPSTVSQSSPAQEVPQMNLSNSSAPSSGTFEMTELGEEDIIVQEDANDSYMSSITSFLSDTINSTRDSFVTLSTSKSEDASRILKSYISGSFSNLFPSSSSSQSEGQVIVETDSLTMSEDDNIFRSKIGSTRRSFRRQSSVDLNWLTRNPYTTVTGRGSIGARPNQSVNAIRNLLDLVTIEEEADAHPGSDSSLGLHAISERVGRTFEATNRMESFESIQEDGSYESSIDPNNTNLASSLSSLPVEEQRKRNISKAETASRLGEGTIRALRDLALDEALELRHALRFWTERLERPMLYYIESGPMAWVTNQNHRLLVSEKVATLQAVLARRVSSIGDLQQVRALKRV